MDLEISKRRYVVIVVGRDMASLSTDENLLAVSKV